MLIAIAVQSLDLSIGTLDRFTDMCPLNCRVPGPR